MFRRSFHELSPAFPMILFHLMDAAYGITEGETGRKIERQGHRRETVPDGSRRAAPWLARNAVNALSGTTPPLAART